MGSEACSGPRGGRNFLSLSFLRLSKNFKNSINNSSSPLPTPPIDIMPPLFASEDLWLPFVSSTEKPEATFLWPKHAVHILHRPCPSLDDDLKNTLEERGILNKEAVEDNKDKMMMREGLEMSAMMCGKGVGKRDIFITFDTFLARSRPGLGEKEGADSKNKKNKMAAAAEGNEPSNWNEEAACNENSKPKTLGWSNPAWGPKPMMGMTRTQSPGLVSTKRTEGPKKPGWKNKALAPTFSRLLKSSPGREPFGRTA